MSETTLPVEGYARPVNVGMTHAERKAMHRAANRAGRLQRAVYMRVAIEHGLDLDLDELRRLVLADLTGRPDAPLEVIQVRLTAPVRERLDEVAAALGVSRYALVRACLAWADAHASDWKMIEWGRLERDATKARRAAASAKGGARRGPRHNTTKESPVTTIQRLRAELGETPPPPAPAA